MNLVKGIGLAVCLLLLIPLCIFLYTPAVATQEKSFTRTITREVETKGAHYIHYVQGDTLYLEDMKAMSKIPLRKVKGEVRQSMVKASGNAIRTYSYLFGSNIVDPVSLNIGMLQSIPYTYDSSIEMSSIYLETLRFDGWEMIGFYSDPNFMDYYFKKNGVFSRVIVLEDSLKIFAGIKGELPDPLMYVRN